MNKIKLNFCSFSSLSLFSDTWVRFILIAVSCSRFRHLCDAMIHLGWTLSDIDIYYFTLNIEQSKKKTRKSQDNELKNGKRIKCVTVCYKLHDQVTTVLENNSRVTYSAHVAITIERGKNEAKKREAMQMQVKINDAIDWRVSFFLWASSLSHSHRRVKFHSVEFHRLMKEEKKSSHEPSKLVSFYTSSCRRTPYAYISLLHLFSIPSFLVSFFSFFLAQWITRVWMMKVTSA